MSISSLGTNDFIDLNKASLLEEEEEDDLDSQYNKNLCRFRYSLRSIDEAETERFRSSLLTPTSKHSSLDIHLGIKSPSSPSSYPESIAFSRNLGNEDTIDLVASKFRDYFDYDLDDLRSSTESITNRSSLLQRKKRPIGLLASLNNIEELKVGMTEEDELLKKNNDLHLSPKSPHHSSNLRYTKHTSSVVQTNTKRKSIDSTALKKLDNNEQQTILKRHHTLNNDHSRPTVNSPLATNATMTPSRSKIPSRIMTRSNTITATTTSNDMNPKHNHATRVGSLLPQPISKRRWSSYDVPKDKSVSQNDKITSRHSILIANPTNNGHYHHSNNTLIIVNNSKKPLPSQHDNKPILDHAGKPLEASTFKVIRRTSSQAIRDKKERQPIPILMDKEQSDKGHTLSSDKRISAPPTLEFKKQAKYSTDKQLTPKTDKSSSSPSIIIPPVRHSSKSAAFSVKNSQGQHITKTTPLTVNTTTSSSSTKRYSTSNLTTPRYSKSNEKDESMLFNMIPNTKEVRFSNPITTATTAKNTKLPFYEQVVHVTASHSSGGFSNSTTSSSHSGDLYYDPPTTSHKKDSPVVATISPQRRKSTTTANIEQVYPKKPTEYRYSSYLSYLKNQREHSSPDNNNGQDTSAASKLIALSRRQRISSEDNISHYKNNHHHSQELPLRQRSSSIHQYSTLPTRTSSIRLNDAMAYNTTPSLQNNQQDLSKRSSFCHKEGNYNTIESVTASARKALRLIQQRRSNQSLETY
ncbi:uncharacterized protein BX663DRAFT_482071 [Cokeromyces recurvatus]|uniref:uncharacterized protein n=1 Tax=Cokeromyces recurvatus TaxID=90255 RepID=UPI00221F0C6C|nr:uncharacterized protein BX663DRAFT_482071 [Cokeromyces recurvatus]KAI7907796.1 hypothetical protein BX663DRAFT_482071 [Cokeromyces recurvatus]